jgi:hypothetical protein
MHKRRWGFEIGKEKFAKVRPGAETSIEFRSTLAILKFFVPGHLNRFELGFVGFLRIAGKAGELRDPFVHVRESDGERIGAREFVAQRDGDVFDGVPIKSWRHVLLLKSNDWPQSHEVTEKRKQPEGPIFYG